MIGVIAKPGQADIVAEFFELFKTPWEFHQSGRSYSAVVMTADAPAHTVNTRLVLLYGGTRATDAACVTRHANSRGRITINWADLRLPLYGDVCTFLSGAEREAYVGSTAGTVGVRLTGPGTTVIRLGYDVFEEARFLLSYGQPAEHAGTPSLEAHIDMMRKWIVASGVGLVEIPPSPAGHAFTVCLTHDIDFIGIRQHLFDHSMFGFVFRSSLGSLNDLLRRRITLRRAMKMWRALGSLPAVYLGWARDFWEPFAWYLRAERGLPATYFLIPDKHRAGERVPGRHASRRASAYDIDDIPKWVETLRAKGCEVAVHGIDAWHSVEHGIRERERITSAAGGVPSIGIRMHWLLSDEATAHTLEQAGYAYDSTNGYNETVGFRAGTGQVFRPLGVTRLLELPLHIQDGALFYTGRLGLSESAAMMRCRAIADDVARYGGVLTVLWHDRSHGPERFWGDFYLRLLEALKFWGAFYGTASQVVAWFERRRTVRFAVTDSGAVRLTIATGGSVPVDPPLCIRIHRAAGDCSDRRASAPVVDMPWTGEWPLDVPEQRAVAV